MKKLSHTVGQAGQFFVSFNPSSEETICYERAAVVMVDEDIIEIRTYVGGPERGYNVEITLTKQCVKMFQMAMEIAELEN